jgi:hypothetical protein
LFEPGGASAWPISPWAICTIDPPPPAAGIGAPVAAAPAVGVAMAPWSWPANDPPVLGGGAGGAGERALLISAMRASVASRLIHTVHRLMKTAL